jgi:hypothetical protein
MAIPPDNPIKIDTANALLYYQALERAARPSGFPSQALRPAKVSCLAFLYVYRQFAVIFQPLFNLLLLQLIDSAIRMFRLTFYWRFGVICRSSFGTLFKQTL